MASEKAESWTSLRKCKVKEKILGNTEPIAGSSKDFYSYNVYLS